MPETQQKPNESTEIVEVDASLAELLGEGGAGAGNVMLATGKEKKPGMFTPPGTELTFLDKDPENDPEKDPEKDSEKDSEKNPEKDPEKDPNRTLDNIDDPDKDKDQKKMNKATMVQAVVKLVEEGVLKPFDDGKPIEEYSVQDIQDLVKVNFEEKEKELQTKTPIEFFDSLPEEMKFAAKYIMDGGQDLKGLFRTLSMVEEVKELDPKTDAAEITRRYLTATQFGTPEEIEEEINGWKDRGELETKAGKFKPKLDSMQEQQVQQTIAKQEHLRKQQAQQAQVYMKNVYDVLEPGELNGLKLDKKTQGMLYSGLVNPAYPSVSGRPTNLLGHLLEKYQFVEPDHALISEALWLLADPEGYKTKVREAGAKDATEKAVRLLKTEQSKKNAGAGGDDDPDNGQRKQKPGTVSRPTSNIFKRQ